MRGEKQSVSCGLEAWSGANCRNEHCFDQVGKGKIAPSISVSMQEFSDFRSLRDADVTIHFDLIKIFFPHKVRCELWNQVPDYYFYIKAETVNICAECSNLEDWAHLFFYTDQFLFLSMFLSISIESFTIKASEANVQKDRETLFTQAVQWLMHVRDF